MWDQVMDLAKRAGAEILKVYEKDDFHVDYKQDDSPLTVADQLAHDCIVEGLLRLNPKIPILSEEGKDIPYDERKTWEKFWLVDPLDGTKEFIKKNGEFTVNIALIENNYPVFGVIYVPVTNTLYVGNINHGSFKVTAGSDAEPIIVNQSDDICVTIVESRSHPSPEMDKFMEEISNKFSAVNRISKGSSLKFCAVAEGDADLYPRMGPTMEWDTAAGQAIVEAAGGQVRLLNGDRLKYNKPNLKNEFFLVQSTQSF